MSNLKTPPTFDDDTNYENYKKEIALWKILIGEDLKPEQMGPALFKAIRSKKAKEKVLELETTDIGGAGGIDKITTKLDEIYEQDKDQKIYIALDDFETYKRKKNMDVAEFVNVFESKHNIIKKYECVLPDGVLAYKLLKAANLETSQEQLCRATMSEWSYKEMLTQMKRVFNDVGSVKEKEEVAIKTEPINFTENMYMPEFQEDEWNYDEQEDLQGNEMNTYYNNYATRNFGSNPRFSRLPMRPNYQPRQYSPQNNNYAPRGMINRRDQRGNVMKCSLCKSIMHFYEDCPYKHQNKAKYQTNNTLLCSVQSILFQSTSPNKLEEMACFLAETVNHGIIDCGATKTVMGDGSYEAYKDTLTDDKLKQMLRSEKTSNIPFRFGDNPVINSYKNVIIPVQLNGVNCFLETEIVQKSLPLLISKESMKKAQTKLDLINDTITMFGIERPMEQTASGHYAIPLNNDGHLNQKSSEIDENCLDISYQLTVEIESSEDKEKVAKKLHSTFSHPKSTRLINMIKASGRNDEELFKSLRELDNKCEVCQKWGRPYPRPAVALPTATFFNEIIALDLKVFVKDKIYFLHLIDHATRYSQAVVIRTKKAQEVVNKMFTHWIALFGRPVQFFSDNGGEFVNEEFMQMCMKFGIKVKTTAAYAPWSNGLVERHNGLIGESVNKVIAETGVSVEIALAWCVAAKNSIHNVYGYSPNQLVFGKNPIYPSILDANLPALEESTSSTIVATHLNALHAARQAMVKSESSIKLKRALKSKTRTHSDIVYQPRDKVYWKKEGEDEWRGPATVLGQDGTQVLLKEGGFAYRVHTTKLRLIDETSRNDGKENERENADAEHPTVQEMQELVMDEIVPQPHVALRVEEETEPTGEQTNSDEEQDEVTDLEVNEPEEQADTTVIEVDELEENEPVTHQGAIAAKHLPKVNSTVRYREHPGEDWITVKIISKAGKAGSNNWHFRNVHNLNTGVDECISFKGAEWQEVEDILIAQSNAKKVDFTEEKLAELRKWEDLTVYETVPDEGQSTVGIKWVLTEKKVDNNIKKKARLVCKGFEELNFNSQRDSPTCQKDSLRVQLSLTTTFDWELSSIDILSAYLQGKPIERDIYLYPPKEANVKGILWKLKQAVYGLNDAGLHWYKRIKEELMRTGGQVSKVDPATFYWLDGQELQGMMICHVDDLMFSGNENFYENTN